MSGNTYTVLVKYDNSATTLAGHNHVGVVIYEGA
jgi:hypothetical protein